MLLASVVEEEQLWCVAEATCNVTDEIRMGCRCSAPIQGLSTAEI